MEAREDFYRLIAQFDEAARGMRHRWYTNDWRAMADYASQAADLATAIAAGAHQVAEREQPQKGGGQ